MRKLIIMCCLLMATSLCFAQIEFMHSLGGKIFIYSQSDASAGGGLLYSPRLNFSSGGNSTFSVGTHLGLGFSLRAGAQGSSRTLLFDLPLVAAYNFGFGSTKDADASFGGWLGAGYGINHFTTNDDYGSTSTSLHGPVFEGGVRFPLNAFGAMEIGASYMADMKTKTSGGKVNVFGISVAYLFGFR